MILNVSGRTDIVAFYSKWFMNRYHAGFVDVRNPFNPKLVSRIYFDKVDAIVFCTRNPIQILDSLKEIKHSIIFHVTLTPYKKDIEPNVFDKRKIIEAIKKISNVIGANNVYVRYDPIFLNEKYTIDYHIKAFKRMCQLLNGYVRHIIVSFIDDYKNVRKNASILHIKEFSEDDYRNIGLNFSVIARENGMTVQTCAENNDLVEYGFIKDDCVSHSLAFKLTGKKYSTWKARNKKNCNCVSMVDIGVYNSCYHLCKYCYANFDEKQIDKNINEHDINSSLLIGTIHYDDIVKERSK